MVYTGRIVFAFGVYDSGELEVYNLAEELARAKRPKKDAALERAQAWQARPVFSAAGRLPPYRRLRSGLLYACCRAPNISNTEGPMSTARRTASLISRSAGSGGKPQPFSALLRSVQEAGEDYEFYPTTDRMIAVVARHLDKSAKTLMDIGAGDGRILTRLAAHFGHPPDLYAVEKSTVLVQAQPENVIPVGTDLYEQNLACLPVDYLFSNPPYSAYETWACIIIESGHARKAFLVLPRRWTDNGAIALSLKKRGATVRILHSDDFYDAPRRARAIVDVVEVSYPLKDEGRGWGREVKDPFDIWFEEHISAFDQEDTSASDKTEYQLDQEALARIRHLTTIEDLVAAYNEEYGRMQENYQAIFKLDYALLKELGVSKDNVREGIKAKMAGLKSKYWTVLFERLDVITNRLSTATKARFLERLTGRVALAFTAGNAYAVVVWAIKNANRYFDEQTVALYRELSTFDGVMNYKSNVRTWAKDDWRYLRHDEEGRRPTHYALEYRIVVTRWAAIGSGAEWQYEYPYNLSKWCHELLADVVAVLHNLGFPTHSPSSMSPERGQWCAGAWEDWYRIDEHAGERGEVLFQVKAHKNGNLHFRFLPEAMRALNVTAGRLLGWLREPADVVRELGYGAEEAKRLFGCMRVIAPKEAQRLLLGEGEE